MTKEIEKSKSAGVTVLKALAVMAFSGLVWKLVMRLLSGDLTEEN
jgi:hypothetical protein